MFRPTQTLRATTKQSARSRTSSEPATQSDNVEAKLLDIVGRVRVPKNNAVVALQNAYVERNIMTETLRVVMFRAFTCEKSWDLEKAAEHAKYLCDDLLHFEVNRRRLAISALKQISELASYISRCLTATSLGVDVVQEERQEHAKKLRNNLRKIIKKSDYYCDQQTDQVEKDILSKTIATFATVFEH